MFTDKSTFTVWPIKNRLRVRRKPGQRWEQQCTAPTFESGFQSVSVWAGFSKQGRTSLVGTVRNFNQHTYCFIIDAHILLFKNIVHGNNALFPLQEGNCGPRRAKSINSYLYSASLNRIR